MPAPAPPRIGIILLSFNRPTMLGYAYDSILRGGFIPGHDRIALVDDGSTAFDPIAWRYASQRSEHVSGIFGMHRSLEDRLTKAALGKLINQGVSHLHDYYRSDIIAYLCDDDLFDTGWLAAIREALASPDGPHMVRGRWDVFRDPCEPAPLAVAPKRTRKATLDWRQMTTGNFAHRIECPILEGLTWPESAITCQDDTFLWQVHGKHPLNAVPLLPVRAGWRREHPYNAAHVAQHGEFGIGAEKLLSREALE